MKTIFFTFFLACLFTCSEAQPAFKPGHDSNEIIQPASNRKILPGKLHLNQFNAEGRSKNAMTTASNSYMGNTGNSVNSSSGRVGIKTTSPLADLHVAGTVKIAGATTLDNLSGSGAGFRMVVVDSNGTLSTLPIPATSTTVDSNGMARYLLNMRPDGYLTSSQVTQEYYFSSSTGNDNNTGTKSSPFQTLSKLNAMTLAPGTRVWLKGGEIFYGTLTINASGNASKPIEIASYGTQKAIINAGNNEGVVAANRNWLIIHDLNILGTGRKNGNTKNGIVLNLCNHSTIKDMVVSGFQKSGVLLESCNTVKAEYIYAHTNGFAGLFVEGEYTMPNSSTPTLSGDRTSKNITIRNAIAENNAGDPTRADNHSGNGILIGCTDNCLVEYCSATNNGYDMPRGGNGPVGIWAFQSDSVIIRKCISYKNRTSATGTDGGGFDLDGGCTHSIIEYCLSYDNEGAGFEACQYNGATPFSDNIIRFCVSINDGTKNTGGFYVWSGNLGGSFKNFTMHNCLFYNRTRSIFDSYSNSATNFHFYNNIFIGNGSVIAGVNSGEKFLGNLYYSLDGNAITFNGYTTLSSWSDATGQEKNSSGIIKGIVNNPNLAGPLLTNLTKPEELHMLNQYKPLTGSPLLGNGLPAANLGVAWPQKDFYGNNVEGSSVAIGLMTGN